MKKVLAVFLSILTVMSFVSFTASAETLVYDNFKYYIKNNVAVVSGYVSSDITSLNIPDTIDEYTVTNIDDYAFKNCKQLSQVQLPSGLTGIGISAFYGCSELKEITIPSKVTYAGNAYTEGGPFGYSGLETVYLENGLTTVAENMFAYCKKLTSVEIPDSVTAIGKEAFKNCTSLSNLKLSKNLSSLGYLAFQNCTSLKTVNINFSGVKYITSQYDGGPFGGSGLETIEIAEGVTQIPQYLFSKCTKLTTVILPSTIKTIDNYAFYYTANVKAVYFKNDIPNYATSAFSASTNCTVFGHETDGKSFAEKNKLNYVSISFDSESRRLNFSGNFKMYSDVDYSFLDKYYDGSMDIEYNHFDKLTFGEINTSDVEIPETSPLYSKLDNESEKLAFSDILLRTENFVLSDSSDFSDILSLFEQDNKVNTSIPSSDPEPEPESQPEKSDFIDNAFNFFRTLANTIAIIAQKIIKKK
ncbi:MAG: leucine-rich repeat domain-containing protein [Acutalibacteraceae bacterium]